MSEPQVSMPRCEALLNDKLPPFCPVCDSREITSLWPVNSNVEGILEGVYWLCCCQKCGCGITFPVPSPEETANLYQTNMYRKNRGRVDFLIDLFLDTMCRWRLQEIGHLYDSPGKLLDVGCGKGRFVAKAVEMGWDAQGIDPSPGQAIAARSRYGIKVFEGELEQMDLHDNCFDVVTAWHVLEHISDPHAVISEVRRILKPGGFLVIEVPNFASWQARLGRDRWFHLDVPRHLLHYTPHALEQILNRHKLSVVESRTFSLESGSVGMLLSALNRTGLPPNYLWQWLKRANSSSSVFGLLYLIAMIAISGPALFLETLASSMRVGGIVRVIARK